MGPSEELVQQRQRDSFLKMKSNHQLVNQDSGDTNYFTPQVIVDAARSTMGGIDLDPASSPAANVGVAALKIFTVKDDGITQKWSGRIWFNPPFGRPEAACSTSCEKEHSHHSFPLHGTGAWINKLIAEIELEYVTEACCITFAATSERWFQPLLRRPQCYLSPRTNYYLPDGTVKKGVTKGSVVTYFGPDTEKFRRCFAGLGIVKV